MELSYSELNEIYLVAQVNEADFSSDYKKAILEAKIARVHKDKELAQAASVMLNRHKNEPGSKWVLCKAHVRTESKLELENAQII